MGYCTRYARLTSYTGQLWVDKPDGLFRGQSPSGWIGQKWADLGGGEAATGCPLDKEHPAANRRGSIVNFTNGAIAFSPDQGDAMTVAAYLEGDALIVDWGSSAPFSYDKWIVRWYRDDFQDIGQTDVGQRSAGHWSTSVAAHRDSNHTYTVVVEGCARAWAAALVVKAGRYP